MPTIETNPEQYLDDDTGKSLSHIAWYQLNRIPRDKHVMDVVTGDGVVYRWTRFGDDEPWTFDHRETPDGRDPTQYQLPSKVETLVERTTTAMY